MITIIFDTQVSETVIRGDADLVGVRTNGTREFVELRGKDTDERFIRWGADRFEIHRRTWQKEQG